MTELEFKSLANQGYNRIPLIAEAFADLLIRQMDDDPKAFGKRLRA